MLVTNFDILKVLKFPKNHQTRFSLKSPILRSKSTLSPLGPQTGLTFKTDICAQLQISQQKEHNLDFLFLNMAETNVGKCTSSVCFPFIFQLFCRLLTSRNIFKSEVDQFVSLRRKYCHHTRSTVNIPENYGQHTRNLVNILEIWSKEQKCGKCFGFERPIPRYL